MAWKTQRTVTHLDLNDVVCVASYFKQRPTLGELYRIWKFGLKFSVYAPRKFHFFRNSQHDNSTEFAFKMRLEVEDGNENKS